MLFRIWIFFLKDINLERFKESTERHIEFCIKRESNKRRLKQIENEIARRIEIQQPSENWDEMTLGEVVSKHVSYRNGWTGYNTRDAYEMRERLGY